jgi:hypothetical protein
MHLHTSPFIQNTEWKQQMGHMQVIWMILF